MLRHGMTVSPVALAAVPRDSAIIEVGRYLVTLPPCPNWSGPAAADFSNMRSSNFGCATASNFGEMVASPADLASGQPLGPAEGMPAAAAVYRYKTDKVVLPTPNSSLPIAAPQTGAPGAGNSPGS
jgi:pilus assembly protein CpaD